MLPAIMLLELAVYSHTHTPPKKSENVDEVWFACPEALTMALLPWESWNDGSWGGIEMQRSSPVSMFRI